jgi:hypothetical protein
MRFVRAFSHIALLAAAVDAVIHHEQLRNGSLAAGEVRYI